MVESQGAFGLKVHPVLQKFYMHDERMEPAWRVCTELDLPVVAHSGPARTGRQYGIPSAFNTVLEDYPDLNLVLSHMGGAAWRELHPFARAHPNTSFDLSEIIG